MATIKKPKTDNSFQNFAINERKKSGNEIRYQIFILKNRQKWNPHRIIRYTASFSCRIPVHEAKPAIIQNIRSASK